MTILKPNGFFVNTFKFSWQTRGRKNKTVVDVKAKYEIPFTPRKEVIKESTEEYKRPFFVTIPDNNNVKCQ